MVDLHDVMLSVCKIRTAPMHAWYSRTALLFGGLVAAFKDL